MPEALHMLSLSRFLFKTEEKKPPTEFLLTKMAI